MDTDGAISITQTNGCRPGKWKFDPKQGFEPPIPRKIKLPGAVVRVRLQFVHSGSRVLQLAALIEVTRQRCLHFSLQSWWWNVNHLLHFSKLNRQEVTFAAPDIPALTQR